MPQNLGAKLSSSVLQARCATYDQDLEGFQSALSEACALYNGRTRKQTDCLFRETLNWPAILQMFAWKVANKTLQKTSWRTLSRSPNSSGPLADIRHVFMQHGAVQSLQTHLDHLSKKLVDMR